MPGEGESPGRPEPSLPPESEAGGSDRFLPTEYEGSVVEAEHVARYAWASQIALGRHALTAGGDFGAGATMLARAGAASVAGIDPSEEAIAEATREHGERSSFTAGELLALPFESGSFDLVTCFDAIERVRDPQLALTELARVLDDDGVLLISTPNRRALGPDDSFRFFDWSDRELDSALREVFGHVRLYRQSLELASVIGDESVLRHADPDSPLIGGVRKLAGRDPGSAHYTLAIAGQRELPALQPAATVTGFRDMRMLAQAIRAWEKRARAAEAELAARVNETSLALLAQQRSNLRLAELENRPLRRLGRLLRGRRSKVDLPKSAPR